MAEQILNRTSEVPLDRFEIEALLNNAFISIFEDAQMLQEATYPTEAEAKAVISGFNQNSIEKISAIPGVEAVPMTLSGDGVMVPNITIDNEPADGKRGIIRVFAVDEENPFRRLYPSESVPAYIDGFNGVAVQDNPGDPFHVLLRFSANIREIDGASIVDEGTGIKAVQMTIRRKALAEISDNTFIEIDALNEYQKKMDLLEDMAKYGMVNSLFKRQLGKLEQALFYEDQNQYVDLKNVNIVHHIGRLGEMHARKGVEHADTVSRSIMDVLGKKMQLGITYEKPAEEQSHYIAARVDARLVDVLMPCSDDDSQIPTLVLIGAGPGVDGTQTTYIEMSKVLGVTF